MPDKHNYGLSDVKSPDGWTNMWIACASYAKGGRTGCRQMDRIPDVYHPTSAELWEYYLSIGWTGTGPDDCLCPECSKAEVVACQ